MFFGFHSPAGKVLEFVRALNCTFVFWVVDHRWLPFAVHLLVPILGHRGVWVGNMLWLLPILGFGVVWVGNLFSLVPLYFGLLNHGGEWFRLTILRRFGRFWILDLLCWEEVPVFLESTRSGFFVVNENLEVEIRGKRGPDYLVLVVWSDDEGVDVRELVILALDVFVDQVVLSLVVEDDVDALGAVATDVGTEHDVVLGVAVHVIAANR